MAWFPWIDGGLGASGSLVRHLTFYKPSADGTLVYLTPPSGDLATELGRVEQAGCTVLQQKTFISEEIGWRSTRGSSRFSSPATLLPESRPG